MKKHPLLALALALAMGVTPAHSQEAVESADAAVAAFSVATPSPSPAAGSDSPAVEPTATPLATPSPTMAPLILPNSTPAPGTASSVAEAWRQMALGVLPAQLVAEGETVPSLSAVRGPLVVRGTVDGDVSVIDGDVFVLGEVRGSISIVSGNVWVLGPVGGRVSVVNGSIYRAASIKGGTSVVNGNVIPAEAGRVTRSGSQRRSSDFNVNVDEEDVLGLLGGLISSTAALLFRSLFGLMWLGLALLTAAIFPTAIDRASQAFLGREGPRSFAIGFLWKLAYWIFGIVFLVASFMLIGLPFLAVLLIFQWVLVMLGAAIVFLALGRWVMRLAGRTTPAFYGAILVGGLLVTAVRMIPVLGDFVWWATAVLCSGVALRQLISLSSSPAAPASAPASLPPTATV